jgi:hypothetical protein
MEDGEKIKEDARKAEGIHTTRGKYGNEEENIERGGKKDGIEKSIRGIFYSLYNQFVFFFLYSCSSQLKKILRTSSDRNISKKKVGVTHHAAHKYRQI